MKPTSAWALVLALLLPSSVLWIHAADDPATTSTTTSTTTTTITGIDAAHMETAQRKELLVSARQAMYDGRRLISDGKYDEAADRYQYALDALNNGGVTEGLYNEAEAGLAEAKAGQAHDLAKDAKFAQAAALLRQAINLQPQNPAYPAMLEDLKKQQIAYEEQVDDPEGTTYNPAVTDEFRDRVATAQKLLVQGDDYSKTGQWDRAEETYSKVLILDPYNKAARDKMDYVERQKYHAAAYRHEEYEDEAMNKVSQDWSEAISTDIVVAPTATTEVNTPSERADITRKLESIIVPSVNFDKLDITEVIDFLTKKSKELDPDHQGINFVLRLTSDTPPVPAPTTPTGATPPGTPAPAPAPTTTIHRAVSITLENVPLADILGYIVQQTNLQYSVEDYAVYLRPSIDEGETLTVRTFLAPATFFSGSDLSVAPDSGGTNATSTTTPTTSAGDAPLTVTSVARNAQPELVSRGIRFPAGATATFLPGSSKLVVRDTPEQLDLIANLIENLSKETPQVEIEAKLAEFNQDAIKGIAFNYNFGTQANVTPNGIGGFNSNLGGSTALRTSFTPIDAPGNLQPGLSPDGINSLIQANNISNTGINPTFPLNGASVTSDQPSGQLQIGAILDGVGFSAVMDAINNLAGVSLLSAPSVTTQNGLKANIDVVREFPYPTSFEKPKLSNTQVAYSAGPSAGANLSLAIPPTPREFQTQDVGVSLEVKPTTYPDQRIDLDITKAQVVDFDGFVNYGVPIVDLLSQNAAPQVLTPGIINQPVFNLRSVVTNLQVLDGQTAVLGGLINESTQEVNDKIPVLGDLPLVGRLFQSKISERTKKNLIIFVTARLIRPNGKPQYVKTLNAEPEEEALPEPPPLGNGPTLPSVPESEPNS